MKKYILIFIAFLVLVFVVYVGSINFSTSLRAKRAVSMGHEYITKVYSDFAIKGEVCQGVDTDGDNYVSCTFRIQNDISEKTINLYCPTIFKSLTGSDCKSAQLMLEQ